MNTNSTNIRVSRALLDEIALEVDQQMRRQKSRTDQRFQMYQLVACLHIGKTSTLEHKDGVLVNTYHCNPSGALSPLWLIYEDFVHFDRAWTYGWTLYLLSSYARDNEADDQSMSDELSRIVHVYNLPDLSWYDSFGALVEPSPYVSPQERFKRQLEALGLALLPEDAPIEVHSA